MTTFRLPTGGRIDRAVTLGFTFNGRSLTGHPGDTLASALLANGVHQVTTSIKLGRPRGIAAAGTEDPNGLVQIEEPFPDPMQLATTVELFDGLVAHGVPGQGRLADVPDSARYDARHVHADVLVVGAGPAGLAAALTAGRAGARVVLIDEQPEAGGHLLGTTDRIDGRPALDGVADAVAELAALPDVVHLQRTTAFGHFDDGYVLALEKRTDHLGAAALKSPLWRNRSRQRVWRVRAKHLVIATGAHERPVVFADNDRPGIMLAGGARTYLHRYGVLAGRHVVVFTTNDSAYAAAVDLADAGARVHAVVDARPEAPARWADECAHRGIPVRTGQVVTGTEGDERVTAAWVAPFGDGRVGASERIACDLLLVSGGWNPAIHLFSHACGVLRYDETLGAFVPGEDREAVAVAGGAAGLAGLGDCLRDGRRAAESALRALHRPPRAAPAAQGVVKATFPTPDVRKVAFTTGAEGAATPSTPPITPPLVLWRVPGGDESVQFVDQQRDATVADVVRAVRAGMRTVEHVKRYTTIGTAHDQGKTSGVVTTGIVAELLGKPVGELGTTTFRPPYTPVAFAALAGRDRGALYDPERHTAVHEWHLERGAVWEDVGQWKRPRYYPQPGEEMDAAVLRECAAVRDSVGILDGSTLGKIDVQGPDAGAFLDRLYTNMMSSLKVGSIRYGVLCQADGMVLDDGTVLRLADDRFLCYTTTGGAAGVLDWMEDFLQTEWTDLRVHLTSVTEQWATFPVVGPRSRDVIGAVFPDIDVSKEGFPFMTWRDTALRCRSDADASTPRSARGGRPTPDEDGVPVRLARVSFSGELAWEVNVDGWHARAVWERLVAAGEPYGITPYGTETMHVLRAEKAYPIIGQDTDGTVTPQDLGMGWVVSKKKPEFLGRRSFGRADNSRPDRKHLVALLPQDPELVLPEGSQVVEGPTVPAPPVPMLGQVTSSYRSAALGRTFALALVKGGRDRIGQVVHVPVGGTPVPVEIAEPVVFDQEGARRDG